MVKKFYPWKVKNFQSIQIIETYQKECDEKVVKDQQN